MRAAGGPTCWSTGSVGRATVDGTVSLQVSRGDGARRHANRMLTAARNRDRQHVCTSCGQHLEVPVPRAIVETGREVHADRRQREGKRIERRAKTGAGRLEVGFPESPEAKKTGHLFPRRRPPQDFDLCGGKVGWG